MLVEFTHLMNHSNQLSKLNHYRNSWTTKETFVEKSGFSLLSR